MVIDWENGRKNIRAPHIQHLLADIQSLKIQFVRIAFAHIYRELNEEADTLSKQALAFQPGMMEIEEITNGLSALQYESI